jgi:hypothetical protein
LQKFKTTNVEKLNQTAKTRDFYKKAYENAEELVKKLQEERDQNLASQLVNFRDENSKLKADIGNNEAYIN